ncbi:fasciclin domain-containing protein [Qipengyuania atrilutea]|uniref:Fasciclin domain-containing protein n=1 Tax=Qipengyuania atrilutea TaxID=2744473 RepID=A0A850HCT5_9SPHN|nr:fasciclin domain-containing protein [Actirhodobacter atriluteus]NVD44919.1 fasciclin domain-containing protein [Actirhodobacter atriluteus]
MTRWKTRAAIAGLMAAALASCGSEPGETANAANGPIDATMAEALASAGLFSSASDAFERTGLDGVLGGEASYTVLAPSDGAFEGLSQDAQSALRDETNGAVLAAVLREHMIPGALTPDDIRQALANNSGSVSMTSFGKGTLTFRMEGDKLVVSNETGQTAVFGNDIVRASNGVVIPIDGVLIDPASLP